jgi:glycosyltransferase involved in cell wall biosynthesis
MSRPVIVCCPARNEAETLRRTLPTWLTFADHVVIADQNSTDDTRAYLSQYPRVTCVNNPDSEYHEGNRNALLASQARQISHEAVLLFLDADETLSGNVLTAPEWKHFCSSPPGTAAAMNWVLLWKSPFQYIRSGHGAPAPQPFAFIDDGREPASSGTMHRPRGIGLQDPTRTFVLTSVHNLHVGTAFFQKFSRRQNWYKAWWINKGGRYYHTNRNHNWIYNVRAEHLANTPAEWLQPYIELKIDITSVEEKDLWWYDVEILRWFAAHGERKYHLLDIWDDLDWESLRQKAMQQNISGLPQDPITGPGRILRIYHRWLARRVTSAGLFDAARRRLIRAVLP